MPGWWEEFVVGWLLMFILPKAVFLPVFRAMWRAMKKTDEQDVIDAIWLAEYHARHGDGGGGGNDAVPAYRRRRPPRPRPTGGGRRAGGARKTPTAP